MIAKKEARRATINVMRFHRVLPVVIGLLLIALEFPKFRDGRAFSWARMLRTRLGYTGEIRAVGDFLYDPDRSFRGWLHTVLRNKWREFQRQRLPIPMDSRDVAFRCSLISTDGVSLLDYSAAHITTDEARPIIELANKKLGTRAMTLFPGVSYRHILRRYRPRARTRHRTEQVAREGGPVLHHHAERAGRRTLPGIHQVNLWRQNPYADHERLPARLSGIPDRRAETP